MRAYEVTSLIELDGATYRIVINPERIKAALRAAPTATRTNEPDGLACFLEPAVTADWLRKLSFPEFQELSDRFGEMLKTAVAKGLASFRPKGATKPN